jgi:hypothetical protein
MGNISLKIYHGETVWDVSGMVKEVVWGGRKGSAARYIEVSMLDDDNSGHPTVKMDLEDGYTCVFKWKGKERFRGIIMKQSRGNGKINKWKAYDECIYLANSKDSFSYENKTATEIFKDCIKRCGLTLGTAVDTGYKIPTVQKPKVFFYDCLLETLSSTYKKKKTRFYIRADQGKVSLLRRKEELTQWVVEPGANLMQWSYDQSIEKIKTRFRIYSKEGKVVYEKKNAKLEKKIGRFIMVDSADEDYNDAQIRELVNSLVDEYAYPEQSLTIQSIGIVSAIAGGCLYVRIPHLDLRRTFYIDEDKHTFTAERHTMQLKLNFATDVASAG